MLQRDATVSKDLHARRKHSKRKLDRSKAKVVRPTPKPLPQRVASVSPQRSILRDGDEYTVHVPDSSLCHPRDALEDLYLVNNAQALTILSLRERVRMLESAMGLTKYVAPALPSKATLDTAASIADIVAIPTRVTKEAAERAKQVIPVSQSGNEAEVLDLAPGVQLLPAPPANVVSIDTAKLPAANDPVQPPLGVRDESGQDEVVKEATAPSKDSSGFKLNGWSADEAQQILDKEFKRRNKQCYQIHGMSYDDIRIKRALYQANAVGFRRLGHLWIPESEVNSGFSAWSKRVSSVSYRVKAGMLYHDTTADGYAVAMCHAELMKSVQPKRRERAEYHRKMEMRSGKGRAGRAEDIRVAHNWKAMTASESEVRPRSKWDRTKEWWSSTVRRSPIARWLGVRPVNANPEASTSYPVIKPDLSTPLSSLVRANNKRGIGY